MWSIVVMGDWLHIVLAQMAQNVITLATKRSQKLVWEIVVCLFLLSSDRKAMSLVFVHHLSIHLYVRPSVCPSVNIFVSAQ